MLKSIISGIIYNGAKCLAEPTASKKKPSFIIIVMHHMHIIIVSSADQIFHVYFVLKFTRIMELVIILWHSS